jgi:hypothetical protein
VLGFSGQIGKWKPWENPTFKGQWENPTFKGQWENPKKPMLSSLVHKQELSI